LLTLERAVPLVIRLICEKTEPLVPRVVPELMIGAVPPSPPVNVVPFRY